MESLETRRLLIRPATPADRAFIYALLNDPAWIEFIGDKCIANLADAEDYINKSLIAHYEKNGYGLQIVGLKKSGQAIGLCGLINRDELQDVDLGYAFLEAYRGHGYAYESAHAIIQHGCSNCALKRIVAITLPHNHSCVSLLKRLGFVFEDPFFFSADSERLDLYALKTGEIGG